MASWIFQSDLTAGIGKRLGVPFMRAQKPLVQISLDNNRQVNIAQSGVGLLGISTIVWDCALHVIDYLMKLEKDGLNLGSCLELGSGTGAVGICAICLGADKCLMTDLAITSCLAANVDDLNVELSSKCSLLAYDWTDDNTPVELTGFTWDTILCSDILYEKKAHAPLLNLLNKLIFNRLILGYKRRHDTAGLNLVLFKSFLQFSY